MQGGYEPPSVDELPHEARVLRLVPTKDAFIPDGATFPTTAAFDPSTEDRSDAARRGLPVRVSVWDRSRTTVAQARTFRRNGPTRAYELPVASVREIRARLDAARLRVVYDPLESLTGPGADGHSGIEGLDRPPGMRKQVLKDIKLELVRALRLAEESA